MKTSATNVLVGFVGQGFVGKNYADDFENRGFSVVRYSHEQQHINNKDQIKKCDIVFVAVPTPTTKMGFDDSIVESTLSLVGKGKIVVIKSTIIPGTTMRLQNKFKNIIVIHSPEFLSEKTAVYESAHPPRNIIGIPKNTNKYRVAAKLVLNILPKASFELICSSTEAEIIKYGKNCLGYIRIMFTNIIFDLSGATGADWKNVQKGMIADPDNSPTYMNPIHKTGRGAGGRCFIKDFAAFTDAYSKLLPKDKEGIAMLNALEEKNISLLRSTKKDLDMLSEVYHI